MAITQEQADKIVAINNLIEVIKYLDADVTHTRVKNSYGKKEQQVILTWKDGEKEIAEALYMYKRNTLRQT
jgi:hypothetical protein|tara:strand:+ start:480 stop:692 length:213 start_codon:yes stop_codon:yes gene_type:complete